METAWQASRLVGVLALVVAAAALATPPGRLPLALRGVCRVLRRDRGLPDAPSGAPAPAWRRVLAFVLVLAAAALAAA